MLFKLLGAPFTLPGAGMRFVFQQIADLADRELNDEGFLREQLLLLQVQWRALAHRSDSSRAAPMSRDAAASVGDMPLMDGRA